MNILPYNLKKPNQYDYYHLAVLSDEKVIQTHFDLTYETAIKELDQIKDRFEFKIIGTLQKIRDCLDYVNRCCNDGILIIFEEDIFNSENTIFVDCTNYFKNVIK